jgi:hypothetical protein
VGRCLNKREEWEGLAKRKGNWRRKTSSKYEGRRKTL